MIKQIDMFRKRFQTAGLLIVGIFAIHFSCQSPQPIGSEMKIAAIDSREIFDEAFGIQTDSFQLIHDFIKPNQFLSEILLGYNVPYPLIHQLAQLSRDVYDVRKLARGKPYTVFCSKDSARTARCFVYQPNAREYVVYDFRSDSIHIRMGQKPIETVRCEVKGTIKTSLYDALNEEENNVMLAFAMADIFAWTIDFYKLQKGDFYKLIYTEDRIEDKAVGINRIEAVLFHHEGRDFYAYYYEQDSIGGDYFDEEANSLRKAFLKTPLKFSRKTSGFTLRRFHPVQKRWKSHLGTDYAAPHGTPIMSTGDGKVIEARYKKFNGNYVKIKHNSMYMTQYLHMSKIRSGIKPGTYVKQGEVIGYVGSTGLATGPHVCYRFWKHGSQVNHLNEEFPPSEPVKQENLNEYYSHMAELERELLEKETNPMEMSSIYNISRLYHGLPSNNESKPFQGPVRWN